MTLVFKPFRSSREFCGYSRAGADPLATDGMEGTERVEPSKEDLPMRFLPVN